MFLSNKEKYVLSFINEYGCATEEQIKAFTNASGRILENLTRYGFIKKSGGIYMIRSLKEPDEKMILCLEILTYFRKKVEWHTRSGFPFYITMFMNGKVFDITAVFAGEETLMSTAIDRASSERVLVGIKNKDVLLTIDKPARFYILSEKMFFREQDGLYIPDDEFSCAQEAAITNNGKSM